MLTLMILRKGYYLVGVNSGSLGGCELTMAEQRATCSDNAWSESNNKENGEKRD